MLELLTPAPSNWLLRTIADVKANKRVFNNFEDALIEGWIRASQAYLESEYQIAILPVTWRLSLASFGEVVHLPNPPLRYNLPAAPESAVVVKYLDESNVEQTLTATEYHAFKDQMTWRLSPAKEWPRQASHPRAVRVDFSVGYQAASKAPEPIRQACLLLAGYYIQHRDATFEEPKISMIDRRITFGVEALMKPYRVTARYSA